LTAGEGKRITQQSYRDDHESRKDTDDTDLAHAVTVTDEDGVRPDEIFRAEARSTNIETRSKFQ
jgi:hypothetical protein